VLSTALSTALRKLPELDTSDLSYHPDAAAWALAAAPALRLDEEDILAALEPDPDPDSPFALAISEHMAGSNSWTGTAEDLLNELPGRVWAQTPKGISQQLRRNLEALAALCILVAFTRKNKARRITLSRAIKGDASPATRARRVGHGSTKSAACTVTSLLPENRAMRHRTGSRRRRRIRPPQASSGFTTLPCTSVSRKWRPWNLKVSLV
jgi:hypothetical protein